MKALPDSNTLRGMSAHVAYGHVAHDHVAHDQQPLHGMLMRAK